MVKGTMSGYRRHASGGKFYAEAIRFRVTPDGTVIRIGVLVGRQIKSAGAAMRILDDLNNKGHVSAWSDSTQQRYVVADRDNGGQWTSQDPFTGERVRINAEGAR